MISERSASDTVAFLEIFRSPRKHSTGLTVLCILGCLLLVTISIILKYGIIGTYNFYHEFTMFKAIQNREYFDGVDYFTSEVVPKSVPIIFFHDYYSVPLYHFLSAFILKATILGAIFSLSFHLNKEIIYSAIAVLLSFGLFNYNFIDINIGVGYLIF